MGVKSIFKFKSIFHKKRDHAYSLNNEGDLMKHTETKAIYTAVFYGANVRYFWGFNHHQKACKFFHNLPTNKVVKV